MSKHISRAELDECIVLCGRHLVGMQTGCGNFRYEFDWEKRTYADDDNAVRQAGTLWGLANLYRLRPDAALFENCRRGLEFYEKYSSTTAAGGRYATYPGQEHGYTGSTALVALALIELLRSPWNEDPTLRQYWRRRVDEYLDFLVNIQLPDGRWPSRYDADTGHAHGEPSPYFDGEILLALARAARHMDHEALREPIARGAAGAYRCHVLVPLRRDPESRVTSGYYQWGTMAMYEMIRAGWSGDEKYADIIAYLGDWMCGTGRLGQGRGNPAASLEGLIHAYDLANTAGNSARSRLYRGTIDTALARMLSLQVGHARAAPAVQNAPPTAPALGGCQHWPDKATLRIDFAQHQLHAAVLASEMLGHR